jgi:hypothetical protein
MIYFSAVLFVAALAGWGRLVFGDHFTWEERRRELCKIGDHWMNKKGIEYHNKQGEYFFERHCRACDYQEITKIEK